LSHSEPGSGPNYNYNFSTQEDSEKVTYHTVVIGGLDPEKTYYWRPVSENSTEVIGKELQFKTEEFLGGTGVGVSLEELSSPQTPQVAGAQTVPGEFVGSSPSPSSSPAASETAEPPENKIAKQAFLGSLLSSFTDLINYLKQYWCWLGWILFLIFLAYLLYKLYKKRRQQENKINTG
jgi:hypothetical protein